MAKFLNTTATNYYLEEIIKNARERVVLISPFLKLNQKIRELLEDKDRLKIDVRIIYGKSELQPEEIKWLKELMYVRTSYCQNLHAKCYLNEKYAIITSMNLYEFSQVNNNEMGVFISKSEDESLYRETYEEAQRIIRISDEVRISVETVEKEDAEDDESTLEKLTSSRIAQKLGMRTSAFMEKVIEMGYLEVRGDKNYITAKGKEIGGEFRMSPKHGAYFLWPADMKLD